MTTNGVNGTNGTKNGSILQWKIGLKSYSGKYLTAESFGFKINVSGVSLKKKQTFILEQDTKEDVVFIRSHTGRYLSADKYGNVTCEAEEPGECEKFAVDYDRKGSGKWAFKNVKHGNYLGGNEESFKCFNKTLQSEDYWTVQLSIHPQVNLKNVNRKRYAKCFVNEENPENAELRVSEIIPWGKEALVILHFENDEYSLKTFDNKFLNLDGSLSWDLTDKGRYKLEIRSGASSGLAFRDMDGNYLTAVGATATMKGRNKNVTRDELFIVEDSCPQVVLTSLNNNKKVSTRQGVDVTANQDVEDEDTDREIFQMELMVPATEESPGRWAFRTVDNTYWMQEPLGGIQAKTSDRMKPEAQFEVDWQGDGTIAIKAKNGSYIQSRQTGQLVATSDTVTNKERFYVRIVNRPLLLLKNEHGFVGLKQPNTTVMCSKTNYEVIFVQPSNDGHYYLKGTNGKYWSVQEDNSIQADSDVPIPFLLEPKNSSILTIKAPNGCYIKGEQNGLFRAVGQEVDSSMLWEY